jgi:hypothetical protein
MVVVAAVLVGAALVLLAIALIVLNAFGIPVQVSFGP